MRSNYLHEHPDFISLLRIVNAETSIDEYLIEKDYWIMHVLYGLKKQGWDFELKGGTSLSKGYQIIDRFSEDIDIHIKPPAELGVEENQKKIKKKHIQSRKQYYDWLAANICIDGIVSIERDYAFDDDACYRSGGIRLYYDAQTKYVEGAKEGILLEVGFDTVAPNTSLSISSWAYKHASTISNISIVDNRAINISCYLPGYTFVEKLQTIATKYRQEQNGAEARPNLMRQYYDVYCLLKNKDVQNFIGTPEYQAHKIARFPKADLEIPIQENEAFLLSDLQQRAQFRQRYEGTSSLYYKGQPPFDELLERISNYIHLL